MTQDGFWGFERTSGRAGTRNHLLVLSVTGLTGPTARRIAGNLHPCICVATPHGSGHLGADAEAQARCVAGFATHPNVGAVVVIGADAIKIEPAAEAAEAASRPAIGLCLDDMGHDALRLTDAGIRAGGDLIKGLSRQHRTSLPISEFALGLECGRSDPSSGLVANPLVGRIADRVVDAGGTAMIGETIEWMGAEERVIERAITPEVKDAIVSAISRREQKAINAGMDLSYNNPSLTNIEAGLSTIEEKSLGAVAKSGSKPIQGVLDYGGTPATPGLWLMDAPSYAPESLTGFAAAGCSLALFTTGVGNSYASTLMPTIKLASNPQTAKRLGQQLDFTAERVFEGRESMEEAAERLFAQLLATASGELTWGEILGDHGEVISRFGASL